MQYGIWSFSISKKKTLFLHQLFKNERREKTVIYSARLCLSFYVSLVSGILNHWTAGHREAPSGSLISIREMQFGP